jgi:uncharacterized protein YkwD
MIRQHLQPLVFGLVVALGLLGSTPVRAQDQPSSLALQVIARINEYRLLQGLNPLVPDARLEAMSRDQAHYILSLPDIPDGDAIHDDAQGRTPRERALLAPYHWETYGSDVQIVIGQNAAIGSVSYAMNFWKNSTIHNRAMLNAVYREIGVWAEPYRSGYLFLVTFGARPNELPVVVDPTNDRLYLTNEYYMRGTGDWLRQAKTIRLYDAAGDLLTEAIPWQSTLDLPAHRGDRLSVVFDDGTRQLTREVDLTRDIVILPDTLVLVEGLAVAAASTSTPTPVPTSPPAAATLAPTPTPPPAQPTPTSLAAATLAPTPTLPPAQPTPTLIPSTATPVVTPAAPDLLIIYDTRSLTIYNSTDLRLDLSQFAVSGSGKTFTATRWTKVAPVALDQYPPQGCMQIWSWFETSDPPTPSVCSYLLSYITVAPADLFWINAEFHVYQGSTLLATCPAGSGVCEVVLPR